MPKIHYTIHMLPRNFPIDGEVANLTSCSNGIWETTQHNRHSGLLTKINSSSVHALSMMTGLAFAIKSLSVPLTDLTNIVISVH